MKKFLKLLKLSSLVSMLSICFCVNAFADWTARLNKSNINVNHELQLINTRRVVIGNSNSFFSKEWVHHELNTARANSKTVARGYVMMVASCVGSSLTLVIQHISDLNVYIYSIQ